MRDPIGTWSIFPLQGPDRPLGSWRIGKFGSSCLAGQVILLRLVRASHASNHPISSLSTPDSAYLITLSCSSSIITCWAILKTPEDSSFFGSWRRDAVVEVFRNSSPFFIEPSYSIVEPVTCAEEAHACWKNRNVPCLLFSLALDCGCGRPAASNYKPCALGWTTAAAPTWRKAPLIVPLAC